MNYNINLPIWLKPTTSTNLIRLGRKYDGGYLVQKDQIVDKKVLVSFGINDDWSFEKDFLDSNVNSKVYLFDKSVSFIQILKLSLKNIFHFPNIYPFLNSLQAIFTYHVFFNQKNVFFYPYFVGREVDNESLSLKNCFDLIKCAKDGLVVKIDIEGSEYRILDDLIFLKDFIDVLIIEFHDVDIHIDKIHKFVDDFSFSIAHLHVNNYSNPDIYGLPKDIEVTFQRYILNPTINYSEYPISNDMPSNRLIPDRKINWI